jgi:hypothetical protein
MERIEYVETNNIFDASHNILALLNNSLIVSTYNAASGIINAAYNYKETGKTIANSKLGQYAKTAYNDGLGYAVNQAYDEIGDFADKTVKGFKNTTWKDLGQSFTNWENYELAVETVVGAKFAKGPKTTGKKSLNSQKSVTNVTDDIPTKKSYKQSRKNWNMETTVNGKKVYQNDDLFDPHQLDGMNRSNIERMEKGLAPLDFEGKSIELHHLIQHDKSSIAEITMDMHNKWNSTIHMYPNGGKPDGWKIDRDAFDKWRDSYWKNRALDFVE